MHPKTKTLALLLFASQCVYAQDHSSWPAYGGDPGGNRYSSVNLVNESNVAQLKPAWTFQTGELKLYDGNQGAEKAAFEATPILSGNTLYFSTPSCRVFAIDPETGKQKWLYDPKVDLAEGFSEITSRGVTAWPLASQQKKYVKYGMRIFVGTIDGRLIAVDAKTGEPVSSFGRNGTIDLQDGYEEDISMTSPPAVIDDLVIAGSSMGDNQLAVYPKGIVRAFSAITGQPVWQWDPVSFDTANKTGAANAWGVLSVDVKRKLIFIPTSSPSPDYYGGDRPGNNNNANSVVALDAKTGKMIWSFQVVHHDLWDYDIAAQPMLIELTKNGKKVPAVAVGTKMGHIFILHRETGKSLFPIEERAVPASDIPGETAAATQPFPVLPKPLGIQEITSDDAWGLTEEGKQKAIARIKKYINKGPFTPPSDKGTLVTPGNVGGIHWGGMCFDPVKNILYTNINRIVPIVRMIARDKVSVAEQEENELLRVETGRQKGSPYVLKRDYLFTSENNELVMQTAPPWGTLHAIDLNSGNEVWQRPFGYMHDTIKYPDANKWGSLNFGGAIATAGNLLFVAATRDNNIRAFHSTSGKLLWQHSLPVPAQSTPMTYQYKGKQYIVIAAGGHGKFFTKLGDYLVAFALNKDEANN